MKGMAGTPVYEYFGEMPPTLETSLVLRGTSIEAVKMNDNAVKEYYLFLSLLKNQGRFMDNVLMEFGLVYDDFLSYVKRTDARGDRPAAADRMAGNADGEISRDSEEGVEDVLGDGMQDGPDDAEAGRNGQYPGRMPAHLEKMHVPLVDQYGRDLTAMAREGRIDPVVGREREIERLVQILSRRKKNNPVLIGEP